MDITNFLIAMINTLHLGAVLFLSYSFLRHLPRAERLLHPFFWFTFQYLHMPVLRLYGISFGLVEPMVDPNWRYWIIYTYAFAFYLCFYWGSIYFTFKSKISVSSVSRRKWMRPTYAPVREYVTLFVLIAIYLAGWGINIASGNYHSLGESRFNTVSTFGALLNFMEGVLFLPIGLALFLYLRDKRLFLFFIVIALIGTMVITAVLSGGRGILIQAMYTLAVFCFLQPKISKILFTAVPLALVVVIGILITFLRGTTYYGAKAEIGEAQYALEGASESIRYGEAGDLAGTVINRFSYYADTWVVLNEMRWGGGGVPRGMYPLGSISDLYMLVPRFIWSSKPMGIRFNYWTSIIIEGRSLPIDFPIGKIGEAYFVLDVFGVLYAFFYAFIFQVFYRYLRMHPNIIVSGIYYLVLFRIVIQGGASMMAFVDSTLKTIILITPILYILSKIFRAEGRKSIRI